MKIIAINVVGKLSYLLLLIFLVNASVRADESTESSVSPVDSRVLCPTFGRSALELANARDQGKDLDAASNYVRSNIQSLGLSTADKRINDLILAMLPENAKLVFQRKDLKPLTLQYATAGVCALKVMGDRKPNHVEAIVESAAGCQNMLLPELRENVLAACVAAEVSNLAAEK